MRLVKAIGYSLLGLLVLLILAALAVVILVDPNDFKEEITQAVRERTGRELILGGELGLSFFPWLALEVRQAQLGNRPDFGAEPFAAIDEAHVGARLWPLLRGELEVGRVRLTGLQLNLRVDEQGRSNWEDLGAGEEDPADEKGAGSPTEAPERADGLGARATIAGLSIRDSALEYRNAQADSRMRLTDFNLETGPLKPGEPVSVELSGKYLGTDEGAKPLPIALRIPALKLDLDKARLDVPEFELTIEPARLNGALTGEDILEAPRLDGRIALDEVSPRKLLVALGASPPPTRDGAVLGTLAFDAALAASAEGATLSGLKLKLDDTQVSGRLGIENFETQALRFDLKVDRIDVDRYLPPEPAGPAAKPGAQAEPIELPLELLKSLNAQGTLDIGTLVLAGVTLKAMKLKVDAQDGLVRLDPLQSRLYEGTQSGAVVVDARGSNAQLRLEQQLSGVDFALLLDELFDSQRLSGRGNARLALAASGNDSRAWLETVDGKIDLSLAEGALEGMDLWYEISRARALLKREAPPAGQSAGRTAFKTFKASATVTDGTVHNRDLDVSTDQLKVTGAGTLKLSTLAVDYLLNASILRAAAPASTAQGETLKTTDIPVRITGTLGDLKVRPDVEARVRAEVEQKVEEKKEEVREKVEKKLQDVFKKWTDRSGK